MIDVDPRRLGYFHNAGYFELGGDDFDGVLGCGGDTRPDALPPYVEAVRFDGGRPLGGFELPATAIEILRTHLDRAPESNPIMRLGKQLRADVTALARAGSSTSSTGTRSGPSASAAPTPSSPRPSCAGSTRATAEVSRTPPSRSGEVASGAKTLEFVFARVVHGRNAACEEILGEMEAGWERAMTVLRARYGS